MHIAFVFPNYWPYVRRGVERLMAEYAQYLVSAGHTVDIITSKPGVGRVVRQGNLTVYYEPQLDHPVPGKYWNRFRFYSFSLSALCSLARRQYDAVHTWFYAYGLGVRLSRQLNGSPYLYHSMAETLVLPGRFDRWLFSSTVPAADGVAALTARAARDLEGALQRPVGVLPPCVDTSTFVQHGVRNLTQPRVFFASDSAEYRKGASLVLMAWDEVHRRCPEAVLSFGGPHGQAGIRPDGDIRQQIRDLVHQPSARAAIEVVGPGSVAELPQRYASAAVTVLPSVGEAFGLVLVESLACGTPVVGNAFEGPGEIISDPAIGATVPLKNYEDLVSPERAHDLAEAVLYAIDLARDPATPARCREHAAQWSRDRVGQRLEQTYLAMRDSAAAPR